MLKGPRKTTPTNVAGCRASVGSGFVSGSLCKLTLPEGPVLFFPGGDPPSNAGKAQT